MNTALLMLVNLIVLVDATVEHGVNLLQEHAPSWTTLLVMGTAASAPPQVSAMAVFAGPLLLLNDIY